jgi:hypothetical protein
MKRARLHVFAATLVLIADIGRVRRAIHTLLPWSKALPDRTQEELNR